MFNFRPRLVLWDFRQIDGRSSSLLSLLLWLLLLLSLSMFAFTFFSARFLLKSCKLLRPLLICTSLVEGALFKNLTINSSASFLGSIFVSKLPILEFFPSNFYISLKTIPQKFCKPSLFFNTCDKFSLKFQTIGIVEVLKLQRYSRDIVISKKIRELQGFFLNIFQFSRRYLNEGHFKPLRNIHPSNNNLQ